MAAVDPNTMFTSATIVSAGVATLAVTVVTTTLHKLAGLPPKWTAFATALVVAYVVVGMQTAPAWYDWVLAFFNACLLFCSATGVNEVGAATTTSAGQGFGEGRPLLVSWFRR